MLRPIGGVSRGRFWRSGVRVCVCLEERVWNQVTPGETSYLSHLPSEYGPVDTRLPALLWLVAQQRKTYLLTTDTNHTERSPFHSKHKEYMAALAEKEAAEQAEQDSVPLK